MSFPAYPEYKDSGVVWLGGIPAHWKIKKFRYVFEESPEKITDEVVGDMLSVSGYRGIEVKQYDDEGRRRTDEELFGYRVVRPGQLVVNTMWLNYAGLGVSEHEGHVSPAYRSYWIDPAMDKRFIHHLMRSGTYVQGYTRLLTGIRPNSLQMGRDDLMVFPVLLPTKSEQTQIARFLDHETARINALIEEQQRLIELLKEKRQAVISHAVTKGLDPTVPMKDSGVEWLGEVPAHWEITQIKRRCDLITDGAHISPETENGVYCFVSTRDVSDEGIDFEGCLRTSADSYEYLVRTGCQPEVGDVLFSKDGTIGRTIVVGEGSPEFVVASSLIIIRPSREELLPSYLDFLCQSWVVSQQVDGFVKGAGLPRLSIQNLTKVVGVFPPLEEQVLIADFLQMQSVTARQLTSEALRTMELLKERRSALISAAVTGKIDVRGWQPSASTQAPQLDVAEAH
ncbi:restriction endonuclease subunit S [Pseudomonas aeruginosa]|uniref:restriction endonuclease subunit S n=1 Tax=Pseudomonas aeruginosa TaxID=287 RepID=UPI00321186F2